MTRLLHIGLLLCVVVACVLPVTGSAGEPPKPPTVEQRVAALERAVATLQAQVAALQKQVNPPQGTGTRPESDTGK